MQDVGSKWAVVTGASSGLGMEFAKALAAKRYNLALTARREKPMQDLADLLRQQHGIEIVVEPLDLTAERSAVQLHERLTALGIETDVLINNAGFGLFGPFLEKDWSKLRDMLQLDVVALTELTHLFARQMAKRGRGHILLVASVAAYQPTPLYAAYGAAKAYVLSLGEALHVEFSPAINVSVISPGLMDTGFLAVSGQTPTAAMTRNMVAPNDVVRIGLDSLFAGRSSRVAGWLNRVAVFANRLTSRHQQARAILRIQQ